jgi:hypothetical protein
MTIESMKQTIKKIAGFLVLVAALSVPALAQDTATNAPAKPGPNRFYGPVTKVDTNASTFSVGDQTFKIVAESEVTTKDGSKGTVADAVVGEPARGSYTKKSDGTLDVTKVRFGKKSGGKAGGKGGGKKKSTGTTPAGGAQ